MTAAALTRTLARVMPTDDAAMLGVRVTVDAPHLSGALSSLVHALDSGDVTELTDEPLDDITEAMGVLAMLAGDALFADLAMLAQELMVTHSEAGPAAIVEVAS